MPTIRLLLLITGNLRTFSASMCRTALARSSSSRIRTEFSVHTGIPHQASLTNGDRLFLIQLHRWFPWVLYADHPAGDPRALASCGLPPLPALQIPLPGRPDANRRRPAGADPADERGQSAVGRAAHPSCSSSAVRPLSPASPNTWSSDVDLPLRDGPPSCAIMHRISPPWTCSLFRPLGFELLYALVIVRLARRELVWINVTPNPTAEWIAHQITEAFPWNEAPRYLIRDRGRVYGAAVTHRLRAMGIRDKPIAPGSPWQNGFAERLIGTIRRECVDHLIALGEAHLRRILQTYAGYYNDGRTD